ncbi:hypothetical protein F2Q69_00050930 [Brassica cretica]|uniref:lactoylglutathione lyase n=1 Tax=Brassica cretica TaxID=69181 RepID=A0A8S9PWP8_BRACR|nr:hypothetical protein F2Q69_00050930 [Brassica cretica]
MRIISMASTIRPSLLGCVSASPRFPVVSRNLSRSTLCFSHVTQSKLLTLRRGVSCLGVAESGKASTAATEEDLLKWVKDDNRRMLHVVYRVGDLDRTIKFYTECLGMKLLRKRDIPEEKYTNAFLGYGPEDSHFVIELTYNYGVDKYDIGAGFGHFGIAVDDVAKTVELIKAKGGKVTREPGAVKGGKTVIAFIEDPDGYKFELLERGPTPEPLCQVMLRVGDLDRSIKFYEKVESYEILAFGMELLRTRDNPEYKYTIAMMGYGPEDKTAVLELTYNYGVTEYDKGIAYAQIAIGTDDVYKTAEAVKLFGGKITREPGPLPGISTKITACLDPDGWKSVFVDNVDFLKELDVCLQYTIAMMGYGPEDKTAVLELTYNYGVTEYDKGNAYAQIAIGTDDVYKTAEAVKLFGGKITREPGPLPGISTKITACLDPDGWKSVFVDNVDFLKELE